MPLTEEQREIIKARARKQDAPEACEPFREVSSALGGVRLDFEEPEPSEGKKIADRQAAKLLREHAQETIKAQKDSEKIPATLASAVALLRYEPEWQDVLAYDEFFGQVVTMRATPWGKRAGEAWTDNDDRKLLIWLQERGCRLGSSQQAGEGVETVARENPRHPVREYLNSLQWDETPRLDTWLIQYAGAEDTPLNRAFASKWMISAVARIMNPGCQVDSYLQLESPQGTGKSTLLRTLAGTEWFTDNISEMGSKDSRLELQGRWIVELAELDRIKGRENSKIKAFMSTRFDNYRPPFARRVVRFPRSCVFASSTNEGTSLTDPTGARRCWPVRVGRIDIAAVEKHRDQLWAEAYLRWKKREPWYLDSKTLQREAQKQTDLRYEPGPWDALIEEWLENPQARTFTDAPFHSARGRVLVRDVLEHCIAKPKPQWTHGDDLSIVKCLTHNGYGVRQSGNRNDGTRGMRFYVREDEQ